MAGLVAGLLAAAPAAAQGVNPNSSENVVPAASGAAGIEARRRTLFSAMLANPGNLDIAFEYAALSAQAGDLEGAISTLERMLVFAPGLPRLQFELGVLYYRLGAYETAATYFRAVEAAPDVPADVLAQVAIYLGEAEQRATGTIVSGLVAVGARYQTNANAGPGTALINIFGGNFILSPNALGQPDANAFVTASLDASLDLENQGDRFDIGLDAYGALYSRLNTLDTGVIELTAGPTFNLQRIGIANATAGLYGVAGGGLLGGVPYFTSLGAGSKLEFVLDARSKVTIRGDARYDTYYDSALRPTASLRSGQHYSAAFGYRYQHTAALGFFLNLTANRRLAQRAFLSSWQTGAEIGTVVRFDSPIAALTQPWSVAVSTGVQHLRGDAPDPVFSLIDPEQTTRAFVQGTLTVPLPNDFALQANASYTRSFSNYGLSAFQNVSVSTALSKGF